MAFFYPEGCALKHSPLPTCPSFSAPHSPRLAYTAGRGAPPLQRSGPGRAAKTAPAPWAPPKHPCTTTDPCSQRHYRNTMDWSTTLSNHKSWPFSHSASSLPNQGRRPHRPLPQFSRRCCCCCCFRASPRSHIYHLDAGGRYDPERASSCGRRGASRGPSRGPSRAAPSSEGPSRRGGTYGTGPGRSPRALGG